MNNSSKSINWINALKALCIVFVFLRHCENYYGFQLGKYDSLYLTFYVNGFFFVSGYLLFWKQLSKPIIQEDRIIYILTGGGKRLFFNILYRIVVPSIIFSIIEFLPSCIIQGRDINMKYVLLKTIGGGTYWFTSALVIADLVLLALFCTRRRNIWFYAAISLGLGMLGLMIVQFGVLQYPVWAWRQGLIALVFLALGGLYWKYEKMIDRLMSWWFVLLLVLVYIGMVFGLKGYNNPMISTLRIQPLGFLTSSIACLLLVWLCKNLPEVKLLSFIGQNSLGFYFMSGALPISLSIVAYKTFSLLGVQLTDVQNALVLLTLWLLCLILAYFIVAFINSRLPWLWDLRVSRFMSKKRN